MTTEAQTKPQIKPINQIVKGTDTFVFNYNPETGLYTYSSQFRPEEAAALAESVNAEIKSNYKGARGLMEGLSADGSWLYNMNTFKGIVLNNQLSRKEVIKSEGQVYFPTIEQGIILQDNRMLPNGFLIDFGAVLFSDTKYHEKIAKELVTSAKRQGFDLPVLASFSSMALQSGGEYGVTPSFVSTQGLITGRDAKKLLKEKFFHAEDSGFLELCRCGGGGWDAYRDDVGGFGANCRVERFSAEGSAQNLRKRALGELESKKREIESGLESVLVA